MLPTTTRSIHYTELRDAEPHDVLYHEWHTYLCELPRWLAEGKEGTFVLIKGTEVIGFFDTWTAADEVATRRFLLQAVLIHQIREREPIYRTRAVA